jgi:hypothetical protein
MKSGIFIQDLDSDPAKIPDDIDRVYKEYHLKKIKEKSEILIPNQIEEPSSEQKDWIKRRTKGSAKTWEAFLIK